MVFHVMINSLRSLGSTRQLLYYMILSQVLNILFDVLFVILIPLGVAGVALAMALSQGLVGIICYFYLSRKINYFRINKEDLLFDFREISLHTKLSLPIGVQSAIITLGSIILQLKVNALGSSPVEAHAIGQRIEAMIIMPLISFGVAMATFTAQNAGAGLMERVWKGIRGSLAISLSYSLLIGVLLLKIQRHCFLLNVIYALPRLFIWCFLFCLLFVTRCMDWVKQLRQPWQGSWK